MKINNLIFRAYDIRGISDPDENQKADLTNHDAYLIGKATATYLIKKYSSTRMAIGRDCRLTSKSLQDFFIKGLNECGLSTVDVGLSISPFIYYATCKFSDIDCGANITASHNPKQYNGIKIVVKNAHSICGDELQEILKIINEDSFLITEKKGTNESRDLKNIYLQELASKFKISKPLKVVVDSGNGTAGIFAPEFLRMLGCEVTELFCDLDGNFPNHEANPEEEKNMQELIKKIKEIGADIGFGFDGDGDRIGIVDEKGHMYNADLILLLLTRDLVTRKKNPKIVFDVKVSQVVINEIKNAGAEPIMSKTGHSFIEQKMKEINADLGGEISGHLFFKENYYGFDDAMFAAGKIAEILSNSNAPFSNMFADLPKTFSTPEIKLACPDNKKFEIVKNLSDFFTKSYPCITIDGVRASFTKNSWGAVRASNTSPNLTLRFEAETQEELTKIIKLMEERLKKFPEINLENLLA
ncbi:MAG: phosphomannomutase/phosphoglucomutase [Candidatus Gracilibacteria bacterium]|jgi:phosphomannomutase/phosphoglucomutase